MPNIAIAYAAGPGQTRRLAEEIAKALGQADCNARLIDVEVMFRIDWDALEASDAIVFGAPTVLGSAAATFKSFMEDTADIAAHQGWADKIAAGFTVVAAPDDDCLATLRQLAGFAARHGMVWVGQDQMAAPDAALSEWVHAPDVWLGLAATAGPDTTMMIPDGDLDRARRFGLRIARATRRWSL